MVTEESLTFGAMLTRCRTLAVLTQEELAERAGMSARGISDLERGVKVRPRGYTIRQLADALQLSTDDRARFAQAASVGGVAFRPDTSLPEGNFLGALPMHCLVAREEEVERFRWMLDAVADGRGHFVLLSGEVGSGKTRLLQHLMIEARDRRFETLVGRCYSGDRATSFYPLLEALGGLDTRLRASSREARRDWQRIQQLVGEYTGDLPTGRSIAQQRIVTAVGDLLVRVAHGGPVALLLDDLHWADADTLKLVRHVAHATRASPILLAASFRDVRLNEQHPELALLLHDLGRERLVERMTVRRLSEDETIELVAATMAQREVSEEFGSFVYRRTKGNPRLIDQLVRSLGGRLELQEEIGAGSMGRVFRAFDRPLARSVAAKLVLARTEIELDSLMRFQQEGAVLAALDHPTIVRIHDTFAEEHATCIIMELLDGQSLNEVLQDGPIPLARVRTLALQVADALAYAHAQSIVHRDIKPDNIMVLSGDRVKVTDFGIARILQAERSLHTVATTGMRMGTPLYMAPEQVAGKGIDGRTDIYALGAVLYHMVTGEPPFQGDDVLEVAVKQLQEVPRPPTEVNPDLPVEWEAVILKALEKDPTRRFQSAAELQAALRGLIEGGTSGLSARGEQGKVRHRGPANSRFVVPAIAVLMTVFVVVAIGLRGYLSKTHASLAGSTCVPAFVASTNALRGDPIYDSFRRAVSELRVTKPFVKGVSQLPDFSSALSDAARQHPCLVVAYDPFLSGILTGVSARYPKVHFASVDALTYNASGTTFVHRPNVEDLIVRREESGYLVGYLAGLMERRRVGIAKHGVIGVMGGMPLPQVNSYIRGYKEGARAADPGIRVLVDYSYNFADRKLAHGIGVGQVGRGADILFNVAGAAGAGYMAAAGERGRYAIGVDVDQRSLGQYVLTSALIHVDRAVYTAVIDAARDQFKSGIHQFGLSEGGSGYATPSKLVPASIAASVRQEARKIAEGRIALRSSLKILSSRSVSASAPRAAAEGTIIVSRDNHWFTIAPNGSHLRMILSSTAGCPDFGCAVFSHRGTRIMMAANAPDKKRITTAILNVDGSGYRALPLPDRTLNMGPGAWSPQNSRIALMGWDNVNKARNGIYAVNASDGRSIERLTTSPDGHNDDPLAYSPDGSRLLFFHEAPPRQPGYPLFGDLFSTTANGSGRVQLNPPGTRVTADFGNPGSWSPNGKRITFTAFLRPAASGRSAVFVEGANGSHQRRITPWGEWSSSAHWSPNGRLIVFDKIEPGSGSVHKVFVVRPNGTGRKAITTASLGGACCAVWSPSGKKVLFEQTGYLYTADADGSGLALLMRNPTRHETAEYAWGP